MDAAEQVERVGLDVRIGLARGLDPPGRGLRIVGRERELGEIERELGVVDHGGRQLGERLAGGAGLVEGEQRLGLDVDRLDQVGLLVDEVERGLEPSRGRPRDRRIAVSSSRAMQIRGIGSSGRSSTSCW